MAIDMNELVDSIQRDNLFSEDELNNNENVENENSDVEEKNNEENNQEQKNDNVENQESVQEEEKKENQPEEKKENKEKVEDSKEDKNDTFKKLLETKINDLKNKGELSEEESKEINKFFDENKTFKKAIENLIKDTTADVLLKFSEEYDSYTRDFLNNVVKQSVDYEINNVKEKYNDFDNYIEDIEKLINDSEKNLSLEEAYLIAKNKKPISIAENKDNLKTDNLQSKQDKSAEDTKKYIEDVFPIKDFDF